MSKFVIRKARQLTAGVQSDRVQGKSPSTTYLPITGQALIQCQCLMKMAR